MALRRRPASLVSAQLTRTHLALGVLDLGCQSLDHAVQLIDLLSGAAQGLSVPDHCGLHLLTLGMGEAEKPMRHKTQRGRCEHTAQPSVQDAQCSAWAASPPRGLSAIFL